MTVGLELHQFFDATDMPSVAERRRQKNLDDVLDLPLAEQIRAEAENVAMIVLARPHRRHFIVYQRGPNAADFIRRHRHSDAAAVEKDAQIALSLSHRLSGGNRVVRVIHADRALAAEIHDLVAHLAQQRRQLPLRFVTPVIARHGYLHVHLFLRPSLVGRARATDRSTLAIIFYVSFKSRRRFSINFQSCPASSLYNSTSPPIGSSISWSGSNVFTFCAADGTMFVTTWLWPALMVNIASA